MSVIKAFMKLSDVLKKHDNGRYIAATIKNIDPAVLHNNVCLMDFYRQFELKDFTVHTGVASLAFIDYRNLKERNAVYAFTSLKKQEYLVFSEQSGGGNPVLFNFKDDDNTPTIYAAYDVVEPFKIANSFHQFTEALTALAEIVYKEFNIYEIYTNDDCDEIKPAFFTSINTRLPIILGDNTENFMRYFFN